MKSADWPDADLENEISLFEFMAKIRKESDLQRQIIGVSTVKSFFKSYSSDISPLASFSDIPTFPHKYFGIFISQGASIGKRCVIFQQVTIGSNLLVDSRSIGYPIIGDDCYIGAGAKIIGNCVIGDNVRIGANAVVTKNIPSNSIVTGSNVISSREKLLDNRYFSYCKRCCSLSTSS